MERVCLDWSEAEVHDSGLKVELVGELGEDFKHSFETTVKLLGDQQWGEVTLEEQAVRVGQVPAGSEDKLRHYLEGVVEQANASLRAGEESDGEDRARGGEQPDGPDAEMQERFRSFAGDTPITEEQGESEN